MNPKPIYKSAPVWGAFIALIAAAVAHYAGGEQYSGIIATVGATILGVFGIKEARDDKALKQ